jgi:hypothetical protein
MAEKSLVNCESESDAALPPAVVLELADFLDEPHAATSAAAATRAVARSTVRFNETCMTPPSWDT